MTQPTVHEEPDSIAGLVSAGDWEAVRELAVGLHPADLAEVLAELAPDIRARVLQDLPTDVIGRVLEFVDEDALAETVEGISPEDLPSVLEDVADDVAADILLGLEPAERLKALASIDLDQAEDIEALLEHAADSAGGIMTRGYIALVESLTVQEVIDLLRVLRPPSRQTYYIYVVDEQDRLVGTVSIRDILVSPPSTPLSEITLRDLVVVPPDADQEEAARLLKKYDLLAIPAVDDEGHIAGIISVDDVIDVLEEEATEDMYRMVGVEEGETIASPVASSVRRRLPWLALNFFTALVAASVVSYFSGTIARAAVLAVFMPIVAGQGGNAGTQTATIAVRSIALGTLDVSDIFRACRKEILVGAVNGLVIGLLAGLVGYAWEHNLALSLVLFVAMSLNIINATLSGVLIPIGLKAANVDPALASNIFVTTMTDVMGFLFFLGIASLVINEIA